MSFLPKNYSVPPDEIDYSNIDEDNLQGNKQWREARAGKITGSCFHFCMSKRATKSWARDKYGISQSAYSYLCHVIWENITGVHIDFSTKGMRHGNKYEPLARDFYTKKYDLNVEQVGFKQWKINEQIGISLDGLVKDGGGNTIEIKNPYSSKFIAYTNYAKVPDEYMAQVQGGLMIYELDFCDFIACEPRAKDMDKLNNIFVVRQYRDDRYIKKMKHNLLDHVDALNKIKFDIDKKRKEGIIKWMPNEMTEEEYKLYAA